MSNGNERELRCLAKSSSSPALTLTSCLTCTSRCWLARHSTGRPHAQSDSRATRSTGQVWRRSNEHVLSTPSPISLFLSSLFSLLSLSLALPLVFFPQAPCSCPSPLPLLSSSSSSPSSAHLCFLIGPPELHPPLCKTTCPSRGQSTRPVQHSTAFCREPPAGLRIVMVCVMVCV